MKLYVKINPVFLCRNVFHMLQGVVQMEWDLGIFLSLQSKSSKHDILNSFPSEVNKFMTLEITVMEN